MDYLQQKQLLLRSILENTQGQTKVIEDEDMEALGELISQRQEMMSQIDALDKKAGNDAYEITSEQEALIKDLLGEIIIVDKTNQSLMKKELDSAQAELLKIRIGRQQGEHYGVEYGLYKEEGVFFDTKE